MRGATVQSLFLLLGLLAVLTAFPRPSFASTYASVYTYEQIDEFSFFTASDAGSVAPPGLVISCYGDATGGWSGCTNPLTAGAGPVGSGDYSASAVGGVVLTNTSDQTIDAEIDYSVWYWAEAYITVDNPATQYGIFRLTQSGPGVDGDFSCSVGAGPIVGRSPEQPWCVPSFNAQGEVYQARLDVEFGVSLAREYNSLDLPPGESMILPAYSNDFTVQFVPEPASLPLLGSGLLLFALLAFRPVRLFARRSSRPSPDA